MSSIPVSRKELPEPEPTAFGAARDGPRDVGQGQPSIHERETRVGGASAIGGAVDGSAADSGPAAVARLDEFRRALVEIGIIGESELDGQPTGVPESEGIIGLSRALQAAGRLTPYPAAAIYQRKSRGLLIGNYLILDKLGAGGMGMVFKARHRRLNRIVALKSLPPSFARDRSAVLRFKREVEAAGRLKHPNIDVSETLQSPDESSARGRSARSVDMTEPSNGPKVAVCDVGATTTTFKRETPASRGFRLPGLVRGAAALIVIVLFDPGSMISGTTAVIAAAPEAKADKRLLIVALRDQHHILARFVTHKKKLLPTEVVALEDILKGAQGADDAEKLKRYLYDRWKSHDVGYVLLVGDAEVIPVRYVASANGGPGSGGWSFMPSDLYYADLARRDGSFDDWNGRKDGIHAGYYGELMGFDGKPPINVDGIDYLPDVAVGRWPVHDTAQLETVAAKTITYETHILANDDWATRRTAFVNSAGLEDVRQQMTNWANRVGVVTGHRPVRLLFRDRQRDDKTPTPSRPEVERLLNAGLSMIFHVGHGSETSWSGCLDLARLAMIRNAELPPIMFSIGCTSARYTALPPGGPYLDASGEAHQGLDAGERFASPAPPPANYQRGDVNRAGLGVEFLRSGPNGAVAYIGCVTGSQSCAWRLMEGFSGYYTSRREPRLGDVWAAAVAHYHNVWDLDGIKPHDWWQVSIFDQGLKFHLFGDPSLQLPRSAIRTHRGETRR